MGKKKQMDQNLLTSLLVVAIVVSVGGVALNLALINQIDVPVLKYTGKVTDTGTVTLTGSGAAGLTLTDAIVSVGSGYVNGTCGGDAAILYSGIPSMGVGIPQAEPYCWINTTAFMNGDASPVDQHTIENNGTIVANVSAIGSVHAADMFCGIGATCLNSSLAKISAISKNNEAESCATGLTAATGETMGTNTANNTVGICDEFNSGADTDTIKIEYNLTVPVGLAAGLRTLTVTYEAVSI